MIINGELSPGRSERGMLPTVKAKALGYRRLKIRPWLRFRPRSAAGTPDMDDRRTCQVRMACDHCIYLRLIDDNRRRWGDGGLWAHAWMPAVDADGTSLALEVVGDARCFCNLTYRRGYHRHGTELGRINHHLTPYSKDHCCG
jgi:hypothetical protein